MPDLIRCTTVPPVVHTHSLQAFLEVPSPRSPESLWHMEQELHKASVQEADQIILAHLVRVHEDKKFVKGAVEQARSNSPVPLIHKGQKEVTVLLAGGTRGTIKTPYLREDRQGNRGPKRKKRGKNGAGVYPVLEALGIRDGVSPATRSEIALYTVQTASYQEAVQLLERRGLSCDISTLWRIASATAQADISLRDAALCTAMNIPVSPHGPLAGKRVRVSVDGGRVRTRKNKKGRKTQKGRHQFTTPWREPRVLVIDLLDEQGGSDPLRLPLYDVLIDNADATFALLIGYLRLLGAANAAVLEFIADGADWIWDRVEQMRIQAEIPESIMVQVVDFYHTCEHLYEAVQLCLSLSNKKRQKLYKKLRHLLRHDSQGVSLVVEQLKQLATTRRGKKMKKALVYFEKHAHRMHYTTLDDMKLPVGSGQVESAVRRVVNLRFKAPGSFWKEATVNGLMHLRAFFKAGRWDELMIRVLTGKFSMLSFDLLPQEETAPINTFSASLSAANLQEVA
jgi:hypothetical protein